MKKIILMMACAIATSTAFAQTALSPDFVLGTREESPFGFMTDNTVRATFISTGQLLFGKNGSTWSDADPTHTNKVIFNGETDLVMDGTSHMFLDATCEIRGGEYGTHYRSNSGAWPTLANADYSYLMMSHAGDGSIVLDSRSDEIFLQPTGGVVHVGRTYNPSITTTNDKLYVDGSATAKGYSASIKKIDFGTVSSPYSVTNDDYTILVAGSTSGTINLPTSGIEQGRMFVIKNIGTGTVSVPNTDGTTTTVSSPNESIIVQLLYTDADPDTWEYFIIGNK